MKEKDNIGIQSNFVQNLILKNREKLSISGIEDVDSFDDKVISVYTNMGLLRIRGNNLNIIKISLESGELDVEGKISALVYVEEEKRKSGLIHKIFK